MLSFDPAFAHATAGMQAQGKLAAAYILRFILILT
jgi:hypothetical protein